MKKKGISLILLVITIIIIIIIASAVILNLNNNNPVNKARLANVQSTRDSLKSGINLYIGKIMVKENGNHNASTMILGKNSLVVNYSIVIDYSIYRTIRGNLNIWELDYDAINSKVNVKLDVYDSNSRWYIDEYGNPYLVYNSLENVSPYLKTEDGSAILASVSDFVVIPGDNQEFAYKGEFYQAKKSRTNVVNSLNTYLANAKSAVSTASIKSIVLGSDSATSSYSIAEDNNQSNAQITLNGEETTLYKINTANFASKVGVSLPSYNSANWYIDENGNTYLIFDENVTIPESLSSSVYSSSYVTNKGGTITSYVESGANENPNEVSNVVYPTYNSGEEITAVDGTKWIVIGNSADNESTIKIMSVDNVKNNLTTAVTGTNMFSTSYYDYKLCYNSSYNSNYETSSIKSYLNNSVKPTLENSLGTTISYIGIWGEEELTALGCIVTWNSANTAVSNISVSNSNNPIFKKSGRYSWIALPDANYSRNVFYMHEYGTVGTEVMTNNCHGARPVIIVPKSVIATGT